MASNQIPTHVAFSDETHHNTGRYRGIALVTLSHDRSRTFKTELNGILRDTHVNELKWQKLDAAIDTRAAAGFIDRAINNACTGRLRIDVLMWDTMDSRHAVAGRDDTANLQRMYYHLFKYVLAQRWPDGSVWCLYPDEQSAMDWAEIGHFLDMASISVGPVAPLFGLANRLKAEFHIVRIRPCKSEAEPLIQMADLFAGLCVWSRSEYKRFQRWERTGRPNRQLALLSQEAAEETRLSHSDRARCPVLDRLDSLCKSKSLGVGLRRSKGLRTYDPVNPINFWWYEPQREEDTAPRRVSR